MIMEAHKEKLLLIRAKRRLTREMLAEKAGISVRTLYKIEKGMPVRMITAVKLCEALEIELAQLDITIVEEQ